MSGRKAFDAIAREPDENGRWELVTAFVKANPSEARQAGLGALDEREARRREVAADLLGQVSTLERDAAPLIADALRPRLAVEQDPAVLASVIYALGHTRDPAAKVELLEHAQHRDENVRFAIAQSLPAFGLEALAARAEDIDDDTRAEGILGLARRKDPRARSLIERELARPVHGSLIEQALEELDA